jgi:nucleoside-diphosphate-sugar epimerase
VVGGAGFVGNWLVEDGLEESIEPIVLDRMSRQSREPAAGADVIFDDVLRADLSALLDDRQIPVVFHLAGPNAVPLSLARPIDDLARSVVTTLAVQAGHDTHVARRSSASSPRRRCTAKGATCP